MTNLEDDDIKTFTEFVKTNEMIGMVVGQRDGDMYIRGGELTLAINEDGGTTAKIQADVIDIDGLITALAAKDIGCANLNVTQGIDCGRLYADQYLYAEGNITCNGTVITDAMTFDSSAVSWQTYTARYLTVSTRHYMLYSNSSGSTTPTGAVYAYPITGFTNTTLHYLGSAST
jgi:hypothetical protein